MTADPTARRHTPLAAKLAAEIAHQGPMSVADFMRRCLWDEHHGYYATRHPLGKTGDFITAPEISQTFGELIGLWSAVIWRHHMGQPQPVTLVELGPGRGTLMSDMLRATAKIQGFHGALRCHLIEASQTLITEQQATLANAGVPVTWGLDLDVIAGPTVIFANEFFDALPEWRCVYVNDHGLLDFGIRPGGQLRPDLSSAFPDAPLGTIFEAQSPDAILNALGALAQNHPVAMLLVDYGHTQTGPGETLQAVRAHSAEHPLTSPGEADLSVQVDFQALAAAARRAGFLVDDPVPQAVLLGRLGIVERAQRLMAANPTQAAAVEASISRLLAPEGMGSRFKAMGLRSPHLAAHLGAQLTSLPGFEVTRSALHQKE
jgi:NADH dehydrogenase [ubiquinone] 1 alpha subcomplex assembly factor 7